MTFKKGHKINLGNQYRKGLIPSNAWEIGHKPWNAGLKGLYKHSEEANKEKSERQKIERLGVNNPMHKSRHTQEWLENLKVKRKILMNKPQIKKKLRIARQKQILEFGGGPNIGKEETQILDLIEKSLDKKILRQYPIDGYFVDGYIPENNIVFEVDEKHHLRHQERDLQRQEDIINKLNCMVIRIPNY